MEPMASPEFQNKNRLDQEEQMSTLFYDATVFTPNCVLERQAVVVSKEGKITFIGKIEDAPHVDGLHLNLRGKILAPGFIDIHVHGGNGVTFGIGDPLEEITAYSRWVASHGVGGYLCSIAAPDHQSLVQIIKGYVKALNTGAAGAEPIGLHLEGPFINREKKGAFNPAWIRNPSVDEAQEYVKAGEGWIYQITLAPEFEESAEVARIMRQAGVTVAIGHTNTTYELASQALRGDFTHVTHTFNAQSSFDHRAPGVFGAVLASDAITAELIADGIHVHPGAMKVLIRCLGTERVVLITDAMTGAALADGMYDLVGNAVQVKDGKATLANGTLAGSIATMDQCVRNANRLAGYPLLEAVKMASLNPARAIGVADRLGSISLGKDASLTVFDESVAVCLTMVKGKIVFNEL